MALHLFASNELHALAYKLSQNWGQAANVYFAPHYIITQTEGMNIWLKQTIAEEQGIAANIQFQKPNDILFKVYRLLGGPFQKTLSRDSYVWLLYQILGTQEFKIRFPQQANYLLDITYDQDLKRMMLAEKIADLFDQYQIYRQEFIQEWSDTPSSLASHWQAYLWAKIEERSELKELHNINNISNYILDHLQNQDYRQRLQLEMPKIILFGLSIFTKYHLNVFFKLAQYIDVDFYLLNPAPELYWGDDKSEKDITLWKAKGYAFAGQYLIGNELLTNWGKLVQNTLRLLFQNDEALNAYEVITGEAPKGGTLLRQMQAEIYNNALFEERATITSSLLKDESIIISSNYTAQREVESLYNYLVHLLDERSETLSGRDILVMCSDIDTYAPFIKAVFDNAPYSFRYNISDVSIASGDNIYNALLALLSINEEHFTAEAILQLLEHKYIRAKYQITDIHLIRKWVHLANVRFGINGRIDDQTYAVSWLNGIKSIMYGMCMMGEMILEDTQGAFIPLEHIEGAHRLEAIRFCAFVSQLIHLIQQRNGRRTITKWMEYVEDFIKQLVFDAASDVDEDFSSLSKTIANYMEASQVMTEELSYDIFYRNFIQHINGDVRSKLFYNEGISFCSIVPMRSIPFKVVAMLGLDANSFPRKETKLNFNLMLAKHQLGDRNIKDSDKHLFLESLLSAEDYFYLSYVGKSIKDNSTKNASILIDELLHYIQAKSPDLNVSEYLVTQHPLHSFSSLYNADNAQLYYYNASREGNKEHFLSDQKVQLEVHSLPKSFDYKWLTKFIKHPILTYFQQTLGWYSYQEDGKIEDHELFETDNLTDYQVRSALFEQFFSTATAAPFIKEWQLKGVLPLKNAGVAYVLQQKEQLEAIITAALPEDMRKGTIAQIAFEFPVDDVVITGQLTRVINKKVVSFSWSQNYFKAFFDTYIDAMIGKTLGLTTGLVFVVHNSKKQIVINLDNDAITENAVAYFQQVLRYYQLGLQAVVEFDIRFLPLFIIPDLENVEALICNYETLLKDLAYDEIQNTYFSRFVNESQLMHGMIQLNALDFYKDLYGSFLKILPK